MGMHWIKEQEKLNVLLKGPTPVFHSARSVIYVSSILNDTDLVWEKVRQVLVMEQSLGQAVDMNQGVQGVFFTERKIMAASLRLVQMAEQGLGKIQLGSGPRASPGRLRAERGQEIDRMAAFHVGTASACRREA